MIAIRRAVAADLPFIAGVMNHYIATSTCTFHLESRTPEDYAAWFRDRTDVHPVTVAEIDGDAVGFAYLSPWRPREAYRRSVEGSVYVHRERQRALGFRTVGVLKDVGYKFDRWLDVEHTQLML